jgi:DNA polymerase-3 subunit alpha
MQGDGLMNFFNLHQHTNFSFLDGFGTPSQYLDRITEIGAPGMALTDHGNIYAHHPFEKAFRDSGKHLVYGCEMYIVDELKDERGYYHITVLAKTNEGYKNLLKLVNVSNDQFYYKPRITFEQLKSNWKGLIILSGCFCDGFLVKNSQDDQDAIWDQWCKEFANAEWYVELQPFKDEAEKWERLTSMAEKRGLPCLATTDSHYPAPEDAKVHDFQLAINTRKAMSDPDRLKLDYPLHLPNYKEVVARCEEMGLWKSEWITDTVTIAQSCEIDLPKSEMIKLGGKIGDLRSRCEKELKNI